MIKYQLIIEDEQLIISFKYWQNIFECTETEMFKIMIDTFEDC